MGFLRWLRKVFGAGAPKTDLGIPEPVDIGELFEAPVSDTLDLHTFQPRDARSVVLEFLDEAARAGLAQVRIIHGKGIGVQRAMVREVLKRHPAVLSFGDAVDSAGWGATVVRLKRGAPRS
jgi:dsDNA-specific endonuclease/ATPase MutS2